MLRPGNFHSAYGWKKFLEGRGVLYAIRLNLDAIENPPPGEGTREGAVLELVKDGGRKQGGSVMRDDCLTTTGKHEAWR